MNDENDELKVYCNGYEAVAAHNEEEARNIVRSLKCYEEEDLDGDGWKILRNANHMYDEDHKTLDMTVGDVLRESPEPRHLWSCEV